MKVFKKKNCKTKLFCYYKKEKLMPITFKRANKLVKRGEGIYVKDNKLGLVFRLKRKPKTNFKQNLYLGIDPGTCFTGYSIYGKKTNINFEFIISNKYTDIENNKKTPKDKTIIGRSETRRMYRRLRRSRLRHRKMRNNNRIHSKCTNTTNYYRQNIIGMVDSISKYCPIKYIGIEDIKFNHFQNKNGKYFSPLEQGKKRLYNELKQYCKRLFLIKGYKTKSVRDRFKAKKENQKSRLSYYAHCIDSTIITLIAKEIHTRKIYKNLWFNLNFWLIQRKNRNSDAVRRLLVREKNKIGNKCKYNRKTPHLSKLKKIRVKQNYIKSNHCSNWEYKYTEPVECFKKFISNYKRFNPTFRGTQREKFVGYWNTKLIIGV